MALHLLKRRDAVASALAVSREAAPSVQALEWSAVRGLAQMHRRPVAVASPIDPELAAIHSAIPSSPAPRALTPAQAEAAAVVDAALGFFAPIAATPTPPTPVPALAPGHRVVTPSPRKLSSPAAKGRRLLRRSLAPAKARPATAGRSAPKAKAPGKARAAPAKLPSARDPMDPSFGATLALPRDFAKLNRAHALVRRDVLEVRRTMSGRVFLRCGRCARLPSKDKAKLATMTPQSVDNLYRSMVRFMMVHVRDCEAIPDEVRRAEREPVEGTKRYWVESAKAAGLRDGPDGRSIVYCAPCLPEL